ncbi:diguanylate cyclase [Neptuniibacter caesariensis]|uniref:diguanylate cyclase n=1 Tax=Neptuniibacter caesariensis TaxID=207954 RepID=A0A7U8GU19_NEPCE|nr:diguanylate cyclase [Neptuniibacter caesariensis]EAR63026.1 GGDEF protein [Oceanospirillum sp. MED92] [Neptuniibacter caesariensis]
MNILVVDDDRFIREIISAVIKDAKHNPITAANAEEALPILDQGGIDLVLTDVEMPGKNGFELTREIRNRFPDNWFPIIFLSGQSDEKHYEEGIDAGGDDYLTKPVSPIVLKAKILAMERIAKMKKDLDSANARLEKLSSQDPLTKISNRRDLEHNLLKEWQRSKRDQTELAAIMLDIDYFKPYNDNYGHQQGDDCLKVVAKTLKKCLNRSHDLVARYGGEEFAIILPDANLSGAETVALQILDALKEANLKHEFSTVADRVTVSMGISSTRFAAETPNALIKQADEALYQAKENGRNRFELYQE